MLTGIPQLGQVVEAAGLPPRAHRPLEPQQRISGIPGYSRGGRLHKLDEVGDDL